MQVFWTAQDRRNPTFYFVDNEFYFAGEQDLMGNIYQDVEKFAFFSKAALSILRMNTILDRT